MTDASAQERTPLNIAPVNVEALIRELPRSRRGGYVEDIVDEQLKKFADTINALSTQHDELANDYNALLSQPRGEQQAPQGSNPFAETEEENAERIAALYREAQRNAREFVDDARQRGNNIINRAETEAEQLRTTVNEEVTVTRAGLEIEVASTQAALAEQVRSTREALEHEVRTTHERLERETAQLNAVRDRLTAETQEIFIRLRGFHETQLETLGAAQESVRFTDDTPAATEVADFNLPTEEEDEQPVAHEDIDTVAMDQVESEEETPVVSGNDDAASEPEVFTPDEPQEAPEASTTEATEDVTEAESAEAETDADAPEQDVAADDEELTVSETGGGDPDDDDETPGKKRRWRR